MRVPSSTASPVAHLAATLLVVAFAAGCMLPTVERSADSTSEADSGDTARPTSDGSTDSGTEDTSSRDTAPEDLGNDGDSTVDAVGCEPPDSGIVRFSEAREVLEVNGDCLSCHSGSQSGAAKSNLEFPSQDPTACQYEASLKDFVVPCDAEASTLIESISEGGTESAREMPIGGWSGGSGINAEKILIDWVNQGARVPACK